MDRQVLIILFVFIFCLNPGSDSNAQNEKEKSPGVIFQASGYEFPYVISKPDQKATLPGELVEISGLCWISPGKLACVQDEDGIIYVYDLDEQEIESKTEFEGHGDYEGIELIGDDAWVLKSNGNLYKVSNWKENRKRSTKKYETDLSKKNDCEGLGFDPEHERLLIACKGFPFLDDKKGNSKKAVYEFDPDEKKLKEKPRFIIDLDQVKYYRKYNTMATWGMELLSQLDESKGDVSFQPSAIAVHPHTGNIYITGAVGDLIMVLHPSGEVLALVELPTALFRQPEGICFDPSGNLYISNEGNNSRANILKFNLTK